MSSKQNNNIRVMCRFRPMNDLEQSKDSTIIYKLLKKNGTMIEHPDKVHHPQPMSFYFDRIFDSKSAQIELFEESALPLIDNIFEGYNATIFAYGQTGSGKTHTMMGDMIKTEMHPRHGIIPRVVREIWNRIVHASNNYEFELKVSFLEIYNEQIYDLLSTDGYTNNSKRRKKHKREKLIIREYSDQVFVENLNEIYVRDQNELFDLIKSANKHRISAETKMNRTSSRSHAVLTIILGQEDIRTGNSKKSKFCLVDLAGSEKVGKTQAKGIRLKEATSINKSLTTLGTCMNKLADNISRDMNYHIPFRESVLTRLLSDSLGGNCKTTLIINTSPCSYNVEETISTLRFGERAKKIKTKARINQIKTPQQYRKELQVAQGEIMKLYRIIENCAEDITSAFKGTLTVDSSTSYKHLLELKKYTLNILKGTKKTTSTNLLANILPDLSHLQSLKKAQTVKKQQKKQQKNSPIILAQQAALARQISNQSISSISSTVNPGAKVVSPKSKAKQVIINKKQTKLPPFDPQNRMRGRNGSFEELNVDEPVKLVRDKKKKINPLIRNKNKKDFRNTQTNSANNAFKPPNFHQDMFNLNGITTGMNIMDNLRADDGLSLGQMGGGSGNFRNDEESDFTDYNSELEHLGIMSPAADGTQSDTSNIESYNSYSYNPYFTYNDVNNPGIESTEYTDFQEEELPKNFFNMNKNERLQFAKNKRVDPLLIEYRFQISREIDWMCWDSGDEEIESDSEIKQKTELQSIDNNNQKNLMLCRLIRTKTQEYSSRLDIEKSKYQSLSAQYRAKNEQNSKLMQQNTNLEKLYEKTENDKRELRKNIKMLKRELAEKTKLLNKLQKKLTLRMNELNIERQNQITFSNDKTSMLRKKVHEKYGKKYMKRIETEIIKNHRKDINLRFDELARAFNEQSSKYCDLEEIIEKSKRQLIKYEELMRQKDNEENALREEIDNEDLIRKELILQHNLEIKKVQENVKKNKNKADMWKRRAFVYKNAVNSLMEEAEFNNLNSSYDDDDEDENDNNNRHNDSHSHSVDEKNIETDDDNPSFDPRHNLRLDVESMAHTTLPTLTSFSPRTMARSLEEEGDNMPGNSATWVKHRKSRQSVGCSDDLISKMALNKNKNKNKKVVVNRGRDKFPKSNYNKVSKRAISPLRNDTFYMTPSQKTALTSVKMKIRGGGGSDTDVHKTPIRTTDTLKSYPTTKKIYTKGSLNNRNSKQTHRRQASQPLNGSLPPPSNRHTGYSSDEYQHPYMANDKSRLDIPVVGIDNLVKNKGLDIDALDQSPSLHFMGAYIPGGQSPRGNFKKRATSPLPPPPRSQKLYPASGIKDRTSRDADDDSDNEEFEDEIHNNANTFLSSNAEQFTSPAGAFFSKIKHSANDDDDYKYNTKPKPRPKPRRKAVPMPEPTGCTDDDEFDNFSDTSNFTDDNMPSYKNTYNDNTYNNNKYNTNTYGNKTPILSRNDSGTRNSRRNLLSTNSKKKMMRMSVTETNFD